MCVHLCVSVCPSVRVSLCVHVSVGRRHDACIMTSFHTRPACEHGSAAQAACLGGPVCGGAAICVVQCNAAISDHLHQMPGQLVAVGLAITDLPLPSAE